MLPLQIIRAIPEIRGEHLSDPSGPAFRKCLNLSVNAIRRCGSAWGRQNASLPSLAGGTQASYGINVIG